MPINDSRINNFPLEGFNKFSIENNNNNNPFYLQNESFNFTQNNKTPNNVFGLPQSQMKGIFQNEDKDHPMFNAQSLAYSENFNPKSCIKNTYINKINNLMSNSLNEFKFNEEKKYFNFVYFLKLRW